MRPSKNKNISAPRRRFLKLGKFGWTLVIVALLVALGFVGKWYIDYKNDQAIASDRARFAQADKKISEVSIKVITAIGTFSTVEESRNCSSPSVKWEESVSTCAVSFRIITPVQSVREGNEIYEKVSNELKVHFELSERGDPKLLPFSVANLEMQELYEEYYFKSVDMRCNASYRLYDSSRPPFKEYTISTPLPFALATSYTCSDKSNVTVYPM